MNRPPQKLVVVGRDAPLWLAVNVLQTALRPAGVEVTAVVLPGRAWLQDVLVTQPALEPLHHLLGVDEAELLRATGGAFTLGQRFVDNGGTGASFFLPHGSHGAPIDGRPFFPYWLKARAFGLRVPLEDFSLTAAAAGQGRIAVPDPATETFWRTDYGYHLPAAAYAAFLKGLAARSRVEVHEARRVTAVLDSGSGSILALDLGDGRRVEGQFFIDVTGEDAALIGGTLSVGRESWRPFFPADRALAAAPQRTGSLPAHGQVQAHGEGWFGYYPALDRIHLTLAYTSDLCGDDQALQVAARAWGARLDDAVVNPLDPGRRVRAWDRNCVALGSAACAFDPLLGLELQALQTGLVHFLSLYPVGGEMGVERDEYNRVAQQAYERMRDVQSALYRLNRWTPSAFWRRAAEGAVSDELRHKIATFAARGEIAYFENESLDEDGWQALFAGLGLEAESYRPDIEATSPETMKREFRRILAFIAGQVGGQMMHEAYLRRVNRTEALA